jgi:FKBP-type peptidyl-prolyl cis-trans isomerase (trigger factor)
VGVIDAYATLGVAADRRLKLSGIKPFESETPVLHAPAIDPDDIVIDAGEPEGPDRRFDFRMPVVCVNQIRARLEAGDQPHEGAALFGLLADVCLEEAVGRFDLTPIWGPLLLPQKEAPQPTPEDDFRCAAMIDTAPDLEWPDFGTLEFVRPVLQVDEAMIDAELAEQRFDAGTTAPSQEPLTRGDQATARIELVLAESDEPLADPIETRIRIPADGQPALAAGLAIEGLADAIRGCVAGEHRTFESLVPEALGSAAHTGKPMRVEVKLVSAERITPASIEDLVAHYESPSEATLRQQVRLSLEHRFSVEQQQYMTDAVFEALVEPMTPPIPRRVVIEKVSEQQEQMIKASIEDGMDPAEAKAAAEDAKKRLAGGVLQQARRTVVAMLLQRKLSVKLSEHDVETRIRAMAALRGVRPEDARKEIVDAGHIDMVAKQVFEAKAAERILAEATVRDVPAAEVGLRGT